MMSYDCRWRVVLVALLADALLLIISPGSAAAFGARRYTLSEKSQFQSGCFPPCLCPLYLEQPVRGRFMLAPTGTQDGGPFETFAVRAMRWTIGEGAAAKNVRGRGTYRIGGEFALTQQLKLDLSIDGAPSQHFDSGNVPPGAAFPAIAARISRNGVLLRRRFSLDAVPFSSANHDKDEKQLSSNGGG
ncbi:MAG: hypothetical protein FJ148_19540 [Deltaproteobacteria bacterium]|nr:hypothetical protein [Deltaproteobacteria bacterium]